jgi:hypothetical protein
MLDGEKKAIIKRKISGILKIIDPSQYIAAHQLETIYHKELSQSCFISARGLLNCCDIHNIFQTSDNARIDFEKKILEYTGKQATIHVNTHGLETFINYYLDLIRFPFILVTGDSDIEINSQYPKPGMLQKILNHSFFCCWFAQNLNYTHPKMIHIPIGLDFHNLWEKPKKQEPLRWSPLSHEVELKKIIAACNYTDQRIPLAYCNWHFTIHRGERAECFKEIDHTICFFELKQKRRFDAYRQQSNYSFVLSPQGKGMDCYRTWEALALGCIPIVKKSPLDSLFSDLPVLILNDWGDLTTDLIQKTLDTFSSRKFNYQKLFLSYWKNFISGNAESTQATQWCSMQEYIIRIRMSIL